MGAEIGGWQKLQWNFLPETGVNAPEAWANLARAGRPGGKGVVVAVLDTGVAYANRGRFRRSPDFSKSRFVRGWDFVEDDPYPNDDNGHGTHVASTIAEGTGNTIGLTGLAYGVKIMPVKVLDSHGEGDSQQIADGIRFAAKHGAQVINLSFEFPSDDHPLADPEHPRRDPLRPPQGRAGRRRVRQRRRRGRRLPGPLRATSCPSAPPPSSAARPTTPTRAATWTSSPRAAASTPPSKATRTARPPAPAWTSSR